MSNPFELETTKSFVAIKGVRAGYIQLACSKLTTKYSQLPEQLYTAAKEWAIILENLKAKRVYWITLSEQVKHLHIHLYPRWSDEEIKGLDLFEDRNNNEQPQWSDELNFQLKKWADEFDVELLGS